MKFFAAGIFLSIVISCSVYGARVPEKPMVVLITSYNNSEWIAKNLRSVLNQRYSNYRIIYIDDCSVDDTVSLFKELVSKRSRNIDITLVCNQERQGALANIYEAVTHCKDEEIIVSLDGDDWFPNYFVLQTINQAYASPDVWLTHGTFMEYPTRTVGWSIPIPGSIVEDNLFRTYRCPSHLRTFYAWLFKKIDVNDLKHEGQFFPMTWDQAIMFPMIEMAGNRHKFIPDIVYVYNMANVINDNKVDAKLQNVLEAVIRSKPSYQRLMRW